MKKLIFLLLLLNTPARAEWTLVNGDDDEDVYVDLATAHKRANIIDIAVLFDYKAAQQWTDYLVYWSKLTQQEFDCDAGKYHRSDSMLYSERMGKGSNVYTVPAGASWRVVKADGVDAVLWKVMCKQ
jgi:hypothetical protein